MEYGNPARILMLIHNFSPGPVGGAELQAEKLSHHLVRLGHEVHILTNSLDNVAQWYDFGSSIPDAPAEETRIRYEPDGTQTSIRIHRPSFLLAYRFTDGYLDTFRYLLANRSMFQVLHSHLAYGHAVVAVVAARLLRRPCIVKVACAGEFGELAAIKKFPAYALALRILQQADVIVAVSREIEAELLAHGFPPQRIWYLPNGVDTEAFKGSVKPDDTAKLRFLLAGRQHPQKGIDIALKAVALLNDRGFKGRFEVLFYGVAYPEYDYRSMAKELGVGDSVSFFDFEKDILGVYRSADALLLPSRNEGLSNTLLEAMAMGLPAIATAVSGNPDVIENGHSGLLIPNESPEALAEAMARLIEDTPLRAYIGRQARIRIESVFSLRAIAEQYSALYQNLLNKKSFFGRKGVQTGYAQVPRG